MGADGEPLKPLRGLQADGKRITGWKRRVDNGLSSTKRRNEWERMSGTTEDTDEDEGTDSVPSVSFQWFSDSTDGLQADRFAKRITGWKRMADNGLPTAKPLRVNEWERMH